MIDTEKFDIAVARASSGANISIGTYNEKTQHRALKFYLEPDPTFHEVPVGSYIADICRDGHIYEIQTSAFEALSSKLEVFLSDYSVTVVYPSVTINTIMWSDPLTGEITEGKRTVKNKNKYKLLSELIYINQFICRENFSIKVIETEISEYRLLDGRGKDRKIKATKCDKVPKSLIDVYDICTVEDIISFVGLDRFVEYDREGLGKLFSLKGRNLSNSIKVLKMLGILRVERTDGRKHFYKVN